MYIIILTSLLALLFTCWESFGHKKNGMLYGFIMVIIVSAIHYDYGNDYMSYYNLYNEIIQMPFDLSSIMAGQYYKEPGWVLLYYAFSFVGGFFMMVAVLSIIQNVIIYNFIKNNVPPKWWPVAVFVYLFYVSFYLMSFTMLRQFFVMCVFLGVWPSIKRKKWVIPLIVLFLCSYIHSSAKTLLPFAFAGFIPMKNNRIVAVAFLLLIISLWVGGSWINQMFDMIIGASDNENYVATYGGSVSGQMSLGLGFLVQELPLLVGLYYLFSSKDNQSSQRLLVLISLLGFAIIPLNAYFPMVGRMGAYFSIFQIATIPIIYNNIRNLFLKTMLLSLFVLITLYDYILFFLPGSVFAPHYHNFNTIFSVIF